MSNVLVWLVKFKWPMISNYWLCLKPNSTSKPIIEWGKKGCQTLVVKMWYIIILFYFNGPFFQMFNFLKLSIYLNLSHGCDNATCKQSARFVTFKSCILTLQLLESLGVLWKAYT